MSTKTRHRMSVGNDNADRECLREIIKRKINEMILNLVYVEQDMMNDLCSTRYDKKIEAHMLLIREIGQKYIEVIESLFNDHDKVTKSNKFYCEMDQTTNDCKPESCVIENDIAIKEEKDENDDVRSNADIDESIPQVCIKQEENLPNNDEPTEHPYQSVNIRNTVYVSGRSLKCIQCDKMFWFYPDFEAHMAICHNEHKPYHCMECDKQFETRIPLIRHIERNHIKKGKYKCDHDDCNKSFYHKSELNKHGLVHKEERTFHCDQCGKCFKQKGGLREHTRSVHDKEKRYQCDVCSKEFYNKGHWIVHKRIHSGEKPYKCSICDKAFTQSYTLTEHNRIH
eukprot:14127_1